MSRERRHRANERRSPGTSSTTTATRQGELPRRSLLHARGGASERLRGARRAPASLPEKGEDFEWEQPSEQGDDRPQTETPVADDGGAGRGDGGKGRGGGGRGGGGDSGGDGDSGGAGLPAGRGPSHPAAPRRPLPSRAAGFLRASWAELQRVQWPDRREVTQATTVVLGFVIVAGLYLGAADWVAQKIINFIL